MARNACAESIIVINNDGYVTATPQIYTSDSNYYIPNANRQVITTESTYYTPNAVTVVRETPVRNSYYYDAPSTSTAIAAGITTAAIGTLLFEGLHHHHNKHKHHNMAPAPRPHHPAPMQPGRGGHKHR